MAPPPSGASPSTRAVRGLTGRSQAFHCQMWCMSLMMPKTSQTYPEYNLTSLHSPRCTCNGGLICRALFLSPLQVALQVAPTCSLELCKS